MLIKPNLKAMFNEINAEHFNGEIPEIPCVWNSRMTTTAGRCHLRVSGGTHWSPTFEPTKIDLSDKLFRNMDYNEKEVWTTMVHEMVHAYLLHKDNERGHTWRFQSMMSKITGKWKNHRCHSYDTAGIRRKNEKKIKCICTRCGYEYRKARMPKHAAYSTYRHRNCGGAIEFTVDKKEDEGKISIF